jgi:peptidyl-prolyl cis-trans isomerase SurA
MALKPGIVSQIVETPDGFHIIEVLEKNGDMFNARHILLKPEYTAEYRSKAFNVLDSLKTELNNEAVTFELAARFYSEDPSTRQNGGQMADPDTGSSFCAVDGSAQNIKTGIKDVKNGEISDQKKSLDNEGRDGNTVYKIIKVDKILPAHPATFSNDYNLLLDNARSELQVKAIEDFISSKIKSTYIVIDPMFEDCVFERDGWYEKFRKAE